MNILIVLKRFIEDKLCDRKYFYSSIKDKKTVDDGKTSDGHISIEDYFTCEKNCTCSKYYELDPCHYFSAAGLSWNAIL